MSYKIAIASSDGIHIDETFGSAAFFHIYEVVDEKYTKVEERKVSNVNDSNFSNCDNTGTNGGSNGCINRGCHAGGGGCSGNEGPSIRVELISDCRCVVCKKIGFRIQKQLERKAITSFDVTCTVEEALNKISSYFKKVDTHQSLLGSAKVTIQNGHS